MTKPSVVRVLNLLMERGMIVKEYYGKIYLTDRGIFVAREVKKQLDEVLAHFPPVEEALTDEERFTAALALTAALPERVFTGRYDQLIAPGRRDDGDPLGAQNSHVADDDLRLTLQAFDKVVPVTADDDS